MLSFIGKVQLLESIIHGMIAYSFQVYAWLICLLKQVDTWTCNFIWSGDVEIGKLATVKWKKLCFPTHDGGLGLRSVQLINDSAILKLA